MGETSNSCTAVAVRYRFVKKKLKNGDFDLLFESHKVIALEVNRPEDQQIETEVIYDEVDVEYLRSLDPKEWKLQDHYKVLGIQNIRIKATEDVIKTAYRKMVLKHHPDKRRAQGEDVREDDDYFTCITMANETLGNPLKRRSYDSVDPTFDDSLPSGNELKDDFYQTFNKYFELNSRWSERRNVPKLGDANTKRADVERFYVFWYDFKSWREYSYEDEEDKANCTDREERRYVDKLNKAERLRKKKEEMSRIRKLVDLAYNNDPRIIKFKSDDKEKKEASRQAKLNAIQLRKEEEQRVLREALEAKEKEEAAERARIEAIRLEREAQKKLLKVERKNLREICQSNKYFASDASTNIKNMSAVDRLCHALSALALEELNKKLISEGKAAFQRAVKECDANIEAEKKASMETYSQRVAAQIKNNASVVKLAPDWSDENVQLLIKAVNLFPVGTNQRWDVVANFMNQHANLSENHSKFNAKMVLAKAKDLQSNDFSKNNLKEAANNAAFDNFIKEKKVSSVQVGSDDISKGDFDRSKSDVSAIQNGELKKVDVPWTKTEQQLLEQALKTFPISTVDRWDRIAECIPKRTKKECMRRCKELVETVKAKKAAMSIN